MSDIQPRGKTIPHPQLARMIATDAHNPTKEDKQPFKPTGYHEYGYFGGCVDYMDAEVKFSHQNKGDAHHGSIATGALKVLRAAGIEPLVLDMNTMKCCGHDQLWQGQTSLFEELKEHNLRRLKESGIKTLIVSCAEGYRTFAVDYDLPGKLGIKVVHAAQILAQRKLKLALPEGQKARVAFHDPCRMGRMMGEYDAPRQLIASVEGAQLVELANHRENGLCCGVSSMMYCNDNTKLVRKRRMDQGVEAGADYLLGGCPKCYMHMQCLNHEQKMAPEERRYPYQMMDLMQFLAMCLQEG